MSKALIQVSMSLDGYVARTNDSDVNGLDDGGLPAKAVTRLRYQVLPGNGVGQR